MSLKTSLFTALRSLVSDRVTPDQFPQVAGVPLVPAIRYTLSGGAIYQDLAGDGDASTDDILIQLDWISDTAAGRDALTPLIRAAMKTIDPPCVMESPAMTTFDTETQLYRAIGHWVVYGSSPT